MTSRRSTGNSRAITAKLDATGSAIGAARLNPNASYGGIPYLLQRVINEGSEIAWQEIKQRIEYTYRALDTALAALDKETDFSTEIKTRVAKGQRLLFKPNIVNAGSFDPITHRPGATTVMTPWPFVAAVMRWCHDRLDISYHQMCLGEAGTTMSATAGAYTKFLGGWGRITTQAVMEGRVGDFYGGWGFYFVRRYLADTHSRGHSDDPMRGYYESTLGAVIPPGKAPDKLLVYDLNKIADDRRDGREVATPGGVNFKTITLHKAIIGGNPANPADRRDWPGSVLINVPKLKVHVTELLTGAVKNLGVGLYPMEVNESQEAGTIRWKYALPHKHTPGMKSLLPHMPWMVEHDPVTDLPRRDEHGQVIYRKTGGMSATMADVISATTNQNIFMLHIVDAIETTNGLQAGPGAFAVAEGLILASCDPLAVDLLGARYIFTNVPAAEGRRLQKELHLPTDFLQKVPLPTVDGHNIITGTGYDSPIPRYVAFRHCEARGIGRLSYYVTGRDLWQKGRLATMAGRLGRVVRNNFAELTTSQLYYSTGKPLHDLQATVLAYAGANDRLTGSNYRESLFAELDENGDGVIDYDEKGKPGTSGIDLGALSVRLQALDIPTSALLKLRFLFIASQLRYADSAWNQQNLGLGKRMDVNTAVLIGLRLSQLPLEMPDPLFPGMTYGKGKWPSIQYARQISLFHRTYGMGFPNRFDILMAPYGLAFRYAALKWGGASYRELETAIPTGDPVGDYHTAIKSGASRLPFVLYVPAGFGRANGSEIPNVRETTDPGLIFTAEYDGGREIWRELSLADIP